MSSVSAEAQEAAVGDKISALPRKKQAEREDLRAKKKKAQNKKQEAVKGRGKRKKTKIKIYKQINVFQVS